MRWTSERRWQLRSGIAFCRIQLGLDEKDTLGEVGPSEIGSSEVSTSKISHPQIGVSEVSFNQACASQVGSDEVSPFESSSDEVGPSVVLLLAEFGSYKFTCVQ